MGCQCPGPATSKSNEQHIAQAMASQTQKGNAEPQILVGIISKNPMRPTKKLTTIQGTPTTTGASPD